MCVRNNTRFYSFFFCSVRLAAVLNILLWLNEWTHWANISNAAQFKICSTYSEHTDIVCTQNTLVNIHMWIMCCITNECYVRSIRWPLGVRVCSHTQTPITHFHSSHLAIGDSSRHCFDVVITQTHIYIIHIPAPQSSSMMYIDVEYIYISFQSNNLALCVLAHNLYRT